MALNDHGHDRAHSDSIESAAAAWLVRQDRGLSPSQQDEFLQWLAAHPAHRESFVRHQRLWSDFNALAEWRPEHSAEPNADLLARRRRGPRFRWLGPVVMALAAAVAFGVWRPKSGPALVVERLAIEATGYRQQVLADGSVVDLNRGARVVVEFSAQERRVRLLQGEAQFTVAKNPARPFVVQAGGVEVRAMGTAFNVKMAGTRLEVLVTEGTVHVSQPPAPLTAGAVSSEAAGLGTKVLAAISAGQRTVIPMAAVIAVPVVVAASGEEIEQLLEWRPRLLDFESTPLADVVETFNQGNAIRLVIGDEELRSLPIVASIRSDNVAGFVRLLEMTMGIRSERRSDGALILRRAR